MFSGELSMRDREPLLIPGRLRQAAASLLDLCVDFLATCWNPHEPVKFCTYKSDTVLLSAFWLLEH